MLSPFERLVQHPVLATICKRMVSGEAGTSGRMSAGEAPLRRPLVIEGLIGAARSLAIGAVAFGRRNGEVTSAVRAKKSFAEKTPVQRAPASVALAVVQSPEVAADVIGDLRAFRSAEEQTGVTLEKASATGLGVASETQANGPFKDNRWEDHTLPAEVSMPEDLKRRLPLEMALFPAWDVLPTESDRPEGAALAGRQAVIDRLRVIREEAKKGYPSTHDPAPESYVIVAPITALMQPCESPEDPGGKIRLQAGETWDPIALGRKLSEIGYERTGQVEVRGEYALRGGLLDIFPYASETPYRIDFFDDLIETISRFDPLSQRSEGNVDVITIADSSMTRLRKLFSPGASGGPWTLLEHLPGDAAVVWLDPAHLAQRAELFTASLISGRSVCLNYSTLRKRADAVFDWMELLPEAPIAEGAPEVSLDPPSDPPLERPAREDPALDRGNENRERRKRKQAAPKEVRNVELAWNFKFDSTEVEADDRLVQKIECTSLQRLQGDIEDHVNDWKRLASSRMALFLFCETGGDQKRLSALLRGAGILPAPHLHLVEGRISGGFDLRAVGLAAISDRELLGRRKRAEKAEMRRRREDVPEGRALQSIFELQIGDHVVHAAHGIARYLGLARLEKSGRMEDYLTLQFAEETRLYVPAAHIHWVSKYVGGAAHLELSRLGAKTWARKKERAEKAIRDLADDILHVQGVRRSLPGIVYPPDDEWQRAFEEAFPYEETPDQRSSIAAVKKDMQATCPMDRLLCGDVGFGKTEVAVRAAFKAVCGGKQFAVLVPTTLLCEQHGRTFRERFAGYPITVETLSRFRSAQEQREILERLAAGRLDGVIGTHRVIQKDVQFKDLGLAIIDEEQRFGVQHKEFFKQLRKSVDVLSLTATPIPRTLHMAMLGLRDISNLTTPPQNRQSIATKVARVSDDLFRRAILREVSRGGQVFIVHPRVHDIQDFCAYVADLVPEARFGIGHGQMDDEELEEAMASFLRAEKDVLVSTTIVENGLDIPTANTIIIHEADRFGLSELHQLRGRVGRSKIQAYCYLLMPEQRSVTPDALRRLRALEEFDELGSGFQLALRDLEIRGAGNVLGAEQSGWIAEIGYDLYCKLLDATVKQLKGEPPPDEELEVNLQLRGPAFIPETYVEDEKAVIEFYRRLDGARDAEAIERLRKELAERFGPLPEPAGRLFSETLLRRGARAARVHYVGIDREEGRLIFKLHDWDMKAVDRALRGIPEVRDTRVLDDETLSIGLMLKAKHQEQALHEQVQRILEPLVQRRAQFGGRAAHTVRRFEP